MDPLAKRVAQRVVSIDINPEWKSEEGPVAEAPPGWEGPVKEMKKDKDVDNPFALAWYMKNKGDKPHKKEALVERVARRYVDTSIVQRVAAHYAEELAAKKVKLPEIHKLEDLMVKLPFTVRVLSQKRGDKDAERDVQRLMGEYTEYVEKVRKALSTALPKTAEKERRKADELLNKIDFFRFGRGTEADILSGRLPSAKFEEDFKKVKPIFHELEQLLKGQQVMFASVAMEHPSEEAKKKYLEEHPNADPANHKVKSQGGGKVDHSTADSEGHKGQARFDDNKNQHTEMKGLLKKVEGADPSAKKKFDRAYDKMFENGEAAAKAAERLLSKYDKAPDALGGDHKEQVEAALELIGSAVRSWHHNKLDHAKGKGGLAGAKMRQAEDTYGHAQQLEALVKDFGKVLKDPNHEIDESWRNH